MTFHVNDETIEPDGTRVIRNITLHSVTFDGTDLTPYLAMPRRIELVDGIPTLFAGGVPVARFEEWIKERYR